MVRCASIVRLRVMSLYLMRSGVAHYKQLYTVNADYEKGFHQGKSGTGATSGQLHVVSDKEHAANVKEQHDKVKEGIARKQIAENDLVLLHVCAWR